MEKREKTGGGNRPAPRQDVMGVGRDAEAIPAVLVKNHGVFTWGPTPEKAVENAVTVEEVAKMALFTEQLAPDTARIEQYLLDKHYFRKHGKDAYYGQK